MPPTRSPRTARQSIAALLPRLRRLGPRWSVSHGEALLGPAESRTLDPGACVSDKLGTGENDRLTGTALGDTLFGLQGNDILKGLRGDDCLFGGVDPIASPARRATTGCLVTTAAAGWEAMTGFSGTPVTTG